MPTVSEIISQILLKKLREEKLSPQEAATLAEWEGRSPEHAAFISMLMDEASLSDKIKNMLAADEQEPWQRIERALEAEWNDRAVPVKRKAPWGTYAAAASVVLLIALAVFYFVINKPAVNESAAVGVPGGNKAILTLADAKQIDLATIAIGKLADQQGTIVSKKEEGRLTYEQTEATQQSAALENLLRVPRGGQYSLVLPDKTTVWLNSESSIRFPVSFNGNERRVEITGEAYFDVTPDAGKKFVVEISQGRRKGLIEVLGTQFNVRAYEDEKTIAATLTKGKIKISAASDDPLAAESIELLPGQKAELMANNTINIVNDIDLEQASAWKDGVIFLNSANINSIMRDIGRWYNIEVVFEGALKPGTFRVGVRRDASMAECIKILNEMGIRCSVENGRLMVRSD